MRWERLITEKSRDVLDLPTFEGIRVRKRGLDPDILRGRKMLVWDNWGVR